MIGSDDDGRSNLSNCFTYPALDCSKTFLPRRYSYQILYTEHQLFRVLSRLGSNILAIYDGLLAALDLIGASAQLFGAAAPE